MRAELQKTNLQVNKADIESAIDIANFNMCILIRFEFQILKLKFKIQKW
jgi:hypothetical protein